MDEEVPHFDVLLGGTEKLPHSTSVSRFTACRSQEIQIMANSLLSQSGSKLAFQTLPKHSRRRAMSHNVKRLPRRLRQIHLNQMKKSGMPAKQKRPSRRYRRRPRNLVEEYSKRSNGKYRWLQTHIWHAKRFHMVQKWGYRLPSHPCDKAFRACYRATTQHCLLQDISYYNCIEICGDRGVIVERMGEIVTVPNTGLSVAAKAYIRGNREGEVTLHDIDVPHKAIGTVNFHWQAVGNGNGSSKLWIWAHAAFYYDVLNALIQSFKLQSTDNKLDNVVYANEITGVKLIELAGKLSRFRLSGPLANAILQDAFIVLDGSSSLSQKWLQEYVESDDVKQSIENQCIYWKSIVNATSTSEISPHIILSLIVKDPRANLPTKRFKCVPSHEKSIECDVPNQISASPLWDDNLREEICTNRPESGKVCDKENKLFHGYEDKFIPVILVQRPGNKTGNIGLGSGWDIILPAVWAKPFWIAFVMRGARVGGLRESSSMLFEMGKSQFLHPDTEAGMEEERRISEECVEKFFRKPPNKRINYNKFRIASPFRWNWKLLIKDWNDSTPEEDFVVLKNGKTLNLISLALNSKTNVVPTCPSNCLIPVQLECEKKGAPSQFAIICLPKCKNDLKNVVMEPASADEHQMERKELRRAHMIILKNLRKQRKKLDLTDLTANKLALDRKEILKNYTKKMRSFWLPEPTTIRNSCSREIIGFVSKGGFSFSHGKSFATGYIAANALTALVKAKFGNKVLFRNTNTRQYKVAKLNVIIELQLLCIQIFGK